MMFSRGLHATGLFYCFQILYQNLYKEDRTIASWEISELVTEDVGLTGGCLYDLKLWSKTSIYDVKDIGNLDETKIIMVPESKRLIARRDLKQVNAITSNRELGRDQDNNGTRIQKIGC